MGWWLGGWLRMVLGASVLLGLTSSTATAAPCHGVRIRSEVSWADGPCGTVVDKSQQSTVHLEYGIARGDACEGEDEVPGAGRFQLFAMCRDNSPLEFMPHWITWADVDVATTAGAVVLGDVDADEVLEDPASGWSDCFVRINDDDARIPLTEADAANGVDWDLTDVTPGVYTLHGYTWDPYFNVWSERTGFLKIHEGDPDAVGPAVAVSSGEKVLYPDETARIEGCTDAAAGATMDVLWSTVAEADWQLYRAGLPVTGETFAFDLDVPPEVLAASESPDFRGQSLMLRIDIHADGRTRTAYMNDLIVVVKRDSGSGSVDASGPDMTTTAEDAADDDAGGCACRATDRPIPMGGAWLVLVVLGRVRRRGARQ